MFRYVHLELKAAFAAAAALIVTLAVLFVVRGSPVLADAWWLSVVAMVVVAALWTGLQASRSKWGGKARDFEAAVPREDPQGVLPAGRGRLLHRPFRWVLFLTLLAVSLPLSFWHSNLALVQLWLTLYWLSGALAAARWERRNGVLLWQGHDRNDPLKLSYTPVSPPPPTRTATDAPPG
ncbi:hypothetical protein [Streptomyces fulvoviolaceus]|uniref:hypothetical protein n=1 Tax=Streptomyces fulvoviolaceus TaxID=285535 RepID=UPI0004CB88D3|nr:hypothetical protein [Streptomyces fulvoviolaceus]MCT9081683.1 hypothetical protein [Streptomyces fulvoviolaceus]